MTDIIIPERDIDLEKLGLINQGLFHVDGELAQRYNAVLSKVFGFESELDSFRVDKRGLSPEVCDHLKRKYQDRLEFGENYLNIKSANRYMIVLSPDQKDAPLIAPQTSYEEGLYDEVYRQARHTIEDLTQSDALFGELDNGITVFQSPYDLMQLRTVKISLDSLDGAGQLMGQLKEMSDRLGEKNSFGTDNALNEEYISQMRGLVGKVGNVDLRNISDIFPIKREVHCFYVEFFRGIHSLRNFKNDDDLNAIYVFHHQGEVRDLGEEVIGLDLHDKDLLKTLHRYKFLKYDSGLIEQRISEIENEVLLEEGIDVVSLPPYEKKRKVIEHSGKLPECWRELRNIAGLMDNTSTEIEDAVKHTTPETKLKLSVATKKPFGKPEIVNHMLAELDSSDVTRVYESNPRKFRVDFPGFPLNRQRYVCSQVLSSLKGGIK
ncbi:Uncharacterised protein [uncultured archaeon]|nr:Uncharacterised protein [uncultured archaeon]